MTPSVSVVVTDFGEREPSWDRLRDCLRAVAAQDAPEPFEVVLCEIPALFGLVPLDIREMLLGLRVISCPSSDPHARKTFGVQNAWAPIVALLDADCMPQPGWLKSIVETFRYYPEVAVVTGEMHGEAPKGWMPRLLKHSNQNKGRSTSTTGDNNVAFRREVYLEYPLPEGSGDGAVQLQSEALLRARYVLWNEPQMVVLRDRRGVRQLAGAPAEQPAAAVR